MDAVQRRDPSVRAYLFGRFELDLWAFTLRADGEEKVLEPQTHRLLAYLVRHRDRVVPAHELRAALWPGLTVSQGTLSQCIWTARRAVGDDSRRQAFIQTLKGVGYRFVAPASERSGAEPAPPRKAPTPLRGRRSQPGFVVWLTGLSGSGKSTIARLLRDELEARGIRGEILDGEEMRRAISPDLGFSRAHRVQNVRRVAFVAGFVVRCGGCAIVAMISPYRASRDAALRSFDGCVEVYTECPLDVLVSRDPKGLYRRASSGELSGLTGVDDPYEAPLAPHVHLRTDLETPERSVAKVIAHLERVQLVPSVPVQVGDGHDLVVVS